MAKVFKEQEAVITACKVMADSGILKFTGQDVSFLLRKIPAEVQEKHYHSDGTYQGTSFKCGTGVCQRLFPEN